MGGVDLDARHAHGALDAFQRRAVGHPQTVDEQLTPPDLQRRVRAQGIVWGYYNLFHLARLPEDHDNARVFAERLLSGAPVQLDLSTVQTNIVVFHLPAALPLDAATLSARARARGVLINAFGARTVRAVTHLDVTREQCETAAAALEAL